MALLHIASVVIKKDIRKAYTLYQRVTKIKGIRASMKGVAFLTRVDLLQDLEEHMSNECFEEIDKIVRLEEDFDLINNLDFMLAVSHVYDLYIMLNKDKLSIDELKTHSKVSDSYRKRAEWMAHEDYNIISANIICMNKYIVLEEYEEALKLADKCLSKYGKSILAEQKNSLLFFKAKALMESNQINEAYKIYIIIKEYYYINDGNQTNLTYLFYIYSDLGFCYQHRGENKDALKSFETAMETLSQLKFDKLIHSKEKQLLAHIQRLEHKI